MPRIGILSGSFDPVHTGHVACALEALNTAKLDRVFLAPEARPRRKPGVTHVAHRMALLRLAVRPHEQLGVLALPDRYFDVARSLPRLQQKFRGDDLFFICGSDMLEHMPHWAHIETMLKHMGLIVGMRGGQDQKKLQVLLNQLPTQPRELHSFISLFPNISANAIRSSLINSQAAEGLLVSTEEYIRKNWLYSPVNQSAD